MADQIFRILDADGDYARVPDDDPRPRYVALNFKLALTKYDTTWTVPGAGAATKGDGRGRMSDLTNA